MADIELIKLKAAAYDARTAYEAARAAGSVELTKEAKAAQAAWQQAEEAVIDWVGEITQQGHRFSVPMRDGWAPKYSERFQKYLARLQEIDTIDVGDKL